MKTIYIFISFILLINELFSQVNSDSLFNSAINDARNKKYDEALLKVDNILQMQPNRYDVIVYAANIKAWKGEYDKALLDIEKAYMLNPISNELYDTWLNILLWKSDYKKLFEVCEIAKKNNYNNNYNIILKKTIAFKNTNEFEKGINFIEENKTFLDSTAIKQLYIEMRSLKKSNIISFYSSLDFFDDNVTNTQYISFIDYAIKIKKHILIPRLNYVNKFNLDDFQPEVDYYHFFNKKLYLYSNLGIGINKTLYPEYKAGLEFYLPILKSTEISLGGRFFNADTSNILIFTGNINTYVKNMWFMFRPFYVIKGSKKSFTTILTSRYYQKNPINYWGIELVYGNSPDERYSISQTSEQLLLSNYKFKLAKNTRLYKYHEINLSIGYSYEEFMKNNFRNRFTLELIMKFKL